MQESEGLSFKTQQVEVGRNAQSHRSAGPHLPTHTQRM